MCFLPVANLMFVKNTSRYNGTKIRPSIVKPYYLLVANIEK